MKENNESENPFAGAPVIFSYTRAQAIEDGVLVDLTQWARETGFRIPVACTAAVWHQYIVPPEGTRELGQSERGRAHDLLWMLSVAIKRLPAPRASIIREPRSSNALTYEVTFLQASNQPKTVTLKSVCGPGDKCEPVLTIMLPSED